jgi:hypothetical protein
MPMFAAVPWLDHDLLFWGLGILLAAAGLSKLAQRRREHLTKLLRAYVERYHDKGA